MNPGLSLLARDLERALSEAPAERTRVIVVTGGVAAGKTTFARALRRSLLRRVGTPVEIASTDGFLRSDSALEREGLLERKGFPESYDHDALARFFEALQLGAASVRVPHYCHRTRGVARESQLARPRWLIVEGVYALQPVRASGLPYCSVFLDAAPAAIEDWYLRRVFWVYGQPRGERAVELRERALSCYERVNRANYLAHIAPLRSQADVVLHKASDHCFMRSPTAVPAPAYAAP